MPEGMDNMPDLGKYAPDVLSAYAVTIVLLAGLVVVSILQSRAAKRRLDEAETKGRKNGR